MTVEHRDTSFEDQRGRIVDIVQDIPTEHAALISSKVGTTRGNHYHRGSTQYVFVLAGRLLVTARIGKKVESAEVGPGDLVTHVPFERHAFLALEDSLFLVLTHGPRGGTNFEVDTVREPV